MTERHIDLHIHSRYSDGLLSPFEILQYAAKRNLCAISITDHDTVEGVKPALEQSIPFNIDVIPGIEISVSLKQRELHFLGYFIDYSHSAIRSYTETLWQAREERAKRIIQLLKGIGFHLSLEPILVKAQGAPLGRPHIAEALVEENYVFSAFEAFEKYLGEGRPAYVPKNVIGPMDAMEIIKDAGGLVFLAHPKTAFIDESDVKRLIDAGLDGIEIIHPKHKPKDINYYRAIAQKYDLLESGGSDCHGGREGQIILGTQSVPFSLLKTIKTKMVKN